MRAGSVPSLLVVLCLTFLPCILAQQTPWYQDIPACGLECLNTTLYLPSGCDRLDDTSYICTNSELLAGMNGCLQTSCMPKEIFSTLNITSVACHAPIRDRAPIYQRVITVLFVLTMLSVALRFAARIAYSKLQWLQDGCMAIVLVLDIAFWTAGYIQSLHGLGKDIWKVPFDEITKLWVWDWIVELTYCPVIGLTRVYFLLFFLSVFPEKRFKRIAWALITFNLVYTTAFILPAIFTCTPIHALWLRWDGEPQHAGKCQNSMPRALSHAAISVTCDFITLALPIRPIMKLQMERKKKVGILLIFCVGALDTIISICRIPFLLHYRTTKNPTYDLLNPAFWSIIEVQVAIICACMPALRLAINRLSSPTTSTQHSSGTNRSMTSSSYIRKSFKFEVKSSPAAGYPSRGDNEGDFVQLVDVYEERERESLERESSDSDRKGGVEMPGKVRVFRGGRGGSVV